MAFTIQKVIPNTLIVLLSTLGSTIYAQNLNECGRGELIVTKKTVGLAQYFAENCQQSWSQQSIQMEFKYRQNIPEWAFKRAANHFLKQNLNNPKNEKLFEAMSNAYKSVKSGDVYRLKYVHNSQTLSLYLNGQLLQKMQHPLAYQYFNIWLGPQPFNVKLKQQLLN